MDLADGSRSVRRVVKDAVGIDEIKRAVSEGQVFGVSLREASLQSCS